MYFRQDYTDVGEAAVRYFFKVKSCLGSEAGELEHNQYLNFTLIVSVVILAVLLAISVAFHVRNYRLHQSRENHFTAMMQSAVRQRVPATEIVDIHPLGDRVELGDPVGQSVSFHSCVTDAWVALLHSPTLYVVL